MRKLSTNQKTWLYLILFLLIFVVISLFFMTGKPKQYPPYVSNSPSPTGSKAFYTYMKKHHYTARWSNKPAFLAKQDGGHLLIMAGPAFTPDEAATKKYESFMKHGNTILLLKSNPKGMFGLNTEHASQSPGAITDKDGHHYKSKDQSPIRLKTKSSDEILLKDRAGTISMKRSFEDGALVVANEPDWITNDKITKKDHTALVLSLLEASDAGNHSILFDEYSHGDHNGPTLTTLYPKWLLVFAVQAFLLVILWLWYQGKRFGSIRLPREEVARFSNERIRALAAWYRRGDKYQESLAIQADYVKLLLQERWGIPYRKAWDQIADYLDRSWKSHSGGEIRSFLEGITNVLRKSSINKEEYLLWSKRIDRLRREVEKD